jgi:hypothetical protein
MDCKGEEDLPVERRGKGSKGAAVGEAPALWGMSDILKSCPEAPLIQEQDRPGFHLLPACLVQIRIRVLLPKPSSSFFRLA